MNDKYEFPYKLLVFSTVYFYTSSVETKVQLVVGINILKTTEEIYQNVNFSLRICFVLKEQLATFYSEKYFIRL